MPNYHDMSLKKVETNCIPSKNENCMRFEVIVQLHVLSKTSMPVLTQMQDDKSFTFCL